MNDNLIEIRDLRVAFAGQAVVHGLNLDIRRGECLALVGESGSGKSVTAHSILRLLPGQNRQQQRQHPLQRRRFAARQRQQMRGLRGNRIAMIFQEPMTSLNPLHTVEKQVSEVLEIHKGLEGTRRPRTDVGAAGTGRHSPAIAAFESLSASALRWAAATGDDRHGAGQRAGTVDRR
jgi:ABC-type microcin C transport system duplicated ATPase subunit YejF